MREETAGTAEGCYICRPENPNAAEDGCSDCELAWELYYEAAYAAPVMCTCHLWKQGAGCGVHGPIPDPTVLALK